MADVFVHIFDIIELTAYRLSDTILTIATEESDTFMLTFNITNMDQEIIKLIPQILPNIAHANTEPTSRVRSTGSRTSTRIFPNLERVLHLPLLLDLRQRGHAARFLWQESLRAALP
jgi:hypothetical protein